VTEVAPGAMTVEDLLAEFGRLGVRVWAEAGRLRFRAPHGIMTDDRRARLRAYRDELLAYLADNRLPQLETDPAARYEPFPLSDVQAAYLLGRGQVFAYGGVGCHGYGELRYPALEPDRMRAAWRALIDRHDMLRAVVSPDGFQRVLPEVPPVEVPVTDLRDRTAAEAEAGLAGVRAEMDHRVYRVDRWPLFDTRITLADGYAVLHVSIDFLIADFASIQVLLDEVHRLYYHPERPLPPVEITFRDYLLAERRLRDSARYERDRAYWLDRVDHLPGAPELPVLAAAPAAPPRFRRWATTLEPKAWTRLRERAGRYGVSPSTAVLAAYAEVLAIWARNPRFTLNLTLLSRLPLHPAVQGLIGDLTSVELLDVDATGAVGFDELARTMQARLWRDMDHRSFTGVEVMREITRRRGTEAALFPVVFTSAIGLAGETGDGGGDFGYGISQTPQVWIDCQNVERNGALATSWDVRDGVFPDGLVPAAFAAYEALLRDLAGDDERIWTGRHPVALPPGQRARRSAVNDTTAALPAGLLHDRVIAQALSTPDRVAVVAAGPVTTYDMTYGELLARAAGVAECLAEAGCRPRDLVAIVMERGWEQVVAVLGTLLAGGVYVPVDTNQPPARRAVIFRSAGIRLVLTQSWLAGGQADEMLAVDTMPLAAPAAFPPAAAPDDLAYVIHTSGSTGAPKGVMISHRGALNTVVDVNTRFGVGAGDRVLALSNLGFDLSVYDIFGPLSVGGALVIPVRDRPGDPSHWVDLIVRHRVTIWNSVPAQLQMMHDYLTAAPAINLGTLWLAMLSGDWIPVPLPDAVRGRIPGLKMVSLGGATEASIWSVLYPIGDVAPDWHSIPYGRPMRNQTLHVLDGALRPRPDWVAGELYIGGTGVAEGYLNDPERTAERFVRHPVTGDRLYRTGDLGRYLPGGEVELLGREDFQVKIRGHRIELAEVETTARTHPAVGGAVVLVDGDRPLERRLVAFVEAARTDPGGQGPVPARLASAAVAAGDEVLAGVDRARYLRFAEGLDRLAIPVMARTLQAAGLFTQASDVHTYPEIVAAAQVAPRHHRLVRRWLRALASEGVLERSGPGWRLVRPIGPHDADHAWSAILQAADRTDAGLLGYFRASVDHLPALLRGDTDPLALLFPQGRVDISQDLYERTLFNRWANQAAGVAVRELARSRPVGRPLRLMEVGAGGGGTTAAVLEALDGIEFAYQCTDLSPYFVGLTEARFAGHDGIRFGTYDLDEDYRAQGLAPGSFDVIVAGDVLHAIADVDRTLGRLRELLAPGGWLVAIEMTRDHYQVMTSLELLIRLDEVAADFADERKGGDRVFLDRQRWLAALERAGGEDARCLPDENEFIAGLGICVLTARFKTDRSPVYAEDVVVHLRERLPEYMVPAAVQVVDALPLTANGKIDRDALRRWLPRRAAAVTAMTSAAPDGDLEQHLAAVWAEALRIDGIGRDDNLFELGGDSLVAAQVAGRMLEEVPDVAGLSFDELLRHVLEHPTVAALTARLADDAPAAGPAAAAGRAADGPVLLAGPDGGETAVILIRAGADGPGASVPLVSRLSAAGPVYDLPADPPDGIPLDRLAAEQAHAITATGATRIRLVGYGPAAMLAVEVGRILTERGQVVDGVTLVGAYRPARTGHETAGALCDAVRRHEPTLYAGDLTLIRPAAGRSADDDALQVWADMCLGDLRVIVVETNHDELLGGSDVTTIAAAVGGTSR
jgi:pyochelin synthetase